ncbi:MAG: oligosaccharide flippase family protein [Bacteroidales bacterium]|jgi:O-antigen/teichoic acid export membrane protein|nr:oligosaccharide flippase family protein [Bacteroidales bacterium]
MLKNLRDSFSKSLVYSFGNLFSKFVGFILLPIITDHVTTEDYAAIGLLESISMFIISFIGFGINSAFERWYWDKNFSGQQKSMFFSIMMFASAVSFIILMFGFGFSVNLADFLLDNANYSYIFRLMIVLSVCELLCYNITSLVRIKERALLFTKASVIRFTVTLGLTLYLLLSLNRGVDGVYEARAAAGLVYLIMLIPFAIKNIQLKFNWPALKEMLIYRLPMLLSTGSIFILNASDKFSIRYIDGMNDTGLYSFAAKIGGTLKMVVITSIWLAVSPQIFKMMNDPNNKRYYQKLMTYITFIVIIFGMGFSVFGKELVVLMSIGNPEFWASWVIIPIITFALYFGILKDVSVTGLNITKKTPVIAGFSFVTSVVNIILNIVFIKYLGYWGAAISTVISQAMLWILIYCAAQKVYFIPYELKKIVLMLVLAAVLIAVSMLITPLNIWVRLPLKIVVIALFPIILYLFRFYEPIEIETMKRLWSKWRKLSDIKTNLTELSKGINGGKSKG